MNIMKRSKGKSTEREINMKIIISPAKKMKEDHDSFGCTKPYFLQESRTILEELQKMNFEALKSLWKCNDDIASLNIQRLKHMDLDKNLTPAIIAYEGLQYQHMSPSVFSSDALEYVKNRLFILSGFYGALRAFDGVSPYRLEMQAKLRIADCKNLYEFWGDKLYRYITSCSSFCDERQSLDKEDVQTIINLASKEYSQIIEKYIQPQDRFITIEFGELIGGKVKQKATLAKMARGEMVRFMAENQVEEVEKIKEFSALDFKFSKECSTPNQFVFIKES